MIFDTLKNNENYKGLGRVYTALKFLAETDFNKMDLGRYELDGDNIYYMVQSYNTDPEKTISEAHKKYIDIQFVLTGREFIDLCPAEELEITEDRLSTDDIAFFKNGEAYSRADLTEGAFVIIFPEEAHRPCVAPDGKGVKVRKAVAKILY